jgi:two-component system, cell cycle response regulator
VVATPIMRRRPPWLVGVSALCAVEALAYLVATRLVSANGTSGRLLGDVVYPVMELVAVVLLGLAARHATGQRRRFFALMAVSTGAGLCGDITWAVLVLVAHRYPTPSLADVLYVLGLVLLGPVLLVGYAFGSGGRRIRALLDASIWLVVLAYMALTLVIMPEVRSVGLGAADVTALVETLLAVLAGLWVTVALMVAHRRLPLGVALVMLGIAAQAMSWFVYSYVFTVRGVEDGSWVSACWQVTWGLLIAGAVAELTRSDDVIHQKHATGSGSVWPATIGVIVLLGLVMVFSPAVSVDSLAIGAGVLGVVIVLVRLHLSLTERQRLAAQLLVLAETDALTELPNRRAFDAGLAVAASRALESGEPAGVLVIDVDHFKKVNDGYGHPVGDRVLQLLAHRLAGVMRPGDTLSRMGGEEFAVLACGVTTPSIAALAERCRHSLSSEPIAVDGLAIPVTISVGAACIPEHARHTEELLRVADRALYVAKDQGRNGVHVGFASSPQRSIPMPDAGSVAWLEALADRLDGEQARQEHSIAMIDIAAQLCRSVGVSTPQRRRCLAAARLHDIGKVGTPLYILTKPAPLTTAETMVMQDHVRTGVELLLACPETRDIAPIVGEHHERIDGTGYPNGKRGDEISVEAQIISVADAWTAMLSDRPYRNALSTAEARRELLRGAGTQFEGGIVAALLDLADQPTPALALT